MNAIGTVYDLVRYPATPMARCDPARLAALAMLLGRDPAPFQACRVLEIGCGEGVNLINLALMAPDSRFLGFDLAATAIDMARDTAARSGLKNIAFRHLDLLAAGADLGAFDYIIAHGVYAWVPEPVREALMRLAGQCLAPQGLFFVSYNVLPGCRLRQMLRDVMMAEIGHVEDPSEKLARMRERLAVYVELWSGGDELARALAAEAKKLLERPAAVVFHDELGECYEPQSFGAVVGHAAQHGLTYLCDADAGHMAAAVAPDGERGRMLARADGDWLRFQEMSDFSSLLRFRESLFCRASAPIDYRPRPEALARLWAFAGFSPGQPAAPGEFAFKVDKGGQFSTPDPNFGGVLTDLAAAAPGLLPLAQIADGDVRQGLLRLAVAHVLYLRSEPHACVYAPGEKPLASPLARVQAERGETRLPSLRQINVDIEDEVARRLILLMDGTRTRREIAAELAEPSGMSMQDLQSRLPDAVLAMAQLGLMMR